MSESTGGEAADVVTTQAAPEAAVLSQSTERDWEGEARKQNWVPEEEFKGDKRPSRFKSAEEFVRDGEMIAMRRDFDDRLKRMEKVNANTVKKLTDIHNQEIVDLKAQRREAIKAGDADEADRLEAVIDKKKETGPDKEAPVDPNEAFQKRNDWYNSDEELTDFAIGVSNTLVAKWAKEHDGAQMPQDEMFKQTEAKVKASSIYKAKFPTKAPGHASVDGGSENPGANRSDPLGKLPAEVRAQAKKDMAKFPEIYPDADTWVKTYQS